MTNMYSHVSLKHNTFFGTNVVCTYINKWYGRNNNLLLSIIRNAITIIKRGTKENNIINSA